MSEVRDTPPYTLKQIEDMLGMGRAVVTGLVSAGFVTPARGPRNELRFSFQDVVLLRTAYHLRAAKVPPRRLLKSLRQLRERLPPELPLSGLRIKAIGADVAVKEGDAHWDAASGQLLMDFEVLAAAGAVALLVRESEPPKAGLEDAASLFGRGQSAEATDGKSAESLYREALAQEPGHVGASINLGAILCDSGRSAEAVEVLGYSIARYPDEPMLHFNFAVALEDLDRLPEAVGAYQRCLVLDSAFADAHYNVARLYERIGDRQGTLRHYSAYRRLT